MALARGTEKKPPQREMEMEMEEVLLGFTYFSLRTLLAIWTFGESTRLG